MLETYPNITLIRGRATMTDGRTVVENQQTTALDRASLRERERKALAEQMGVSLAQVPHDYGEYFDDLKERGVEIYGNQTMMVLYNIDPATIASAVTPIPLERMVQLFNSVDRIIVY
jgi:hypothetical protein